MGMEELSCKTPAMARKELWTYLLAYNMVRRLLAAAALERGRQPRQLSKAGALQTLEAFRSELQGREMGSEASEALIRVVLRLVGSHQVGERPGRVEPRRTKRRQQKYPLLRQPRGEARAPLGIRGKRRGK
jgi:hypothetical protein